MKLGIVLEGGAMRGLFTAGVLDVLMENGIVCDGMVGVSAGATFGCNYKSKQIGRTLRYNLKYCRDKRYCSFSSLIKTGDLYGADFCYRQIPNELDIFDTKAFLENPMEFYIVCSDIDSGKPLYYKYEKSDDRDLEYMRASASMPLVSRIVEIDGKRLLDGGMTDSIPLQFSEKSCIMFS
jgi:predicted patatin/cPLA2 family phospholipase